MSDQTPQREDDAVPAETQETGTRRRTILRWTRRAFALLVAILATVFVSFFTIDLGHFPQLKRLAEEHGSRFIERPLHIGRISAFITPGAFTLHDIVIEGRAPGDRPYMTINRIRVNVPWWTIFRREVHLNVRIDGWTMVVETWANGVHNVPRLGGPRREPRTGPPRVTTTIDFAYALDGHFTFEDHVTPWSVVAPNLSVEFVRSTALNQYVGRAGFKGGTVQIQSYEPMATDMESRFELDGSFVKVRHLDLIADGSLSHVHGEIDMANWPNQVYHVNSEIDFSRMKELFFARETWRLGGEGRFAGQFLLGKNNVRDLTGRFSSDQATVNDLDFQNLHGALTWTPTTFAVSHAEANLLEGQTRFRYSLAPLGTSSPATATFEAEYSNVDLFEIDRLMSLRGLRLAGTASGHLSMQWPNGRMSTGRRGVGRTVVTPFAGTPPLAPIDLPDDPLPPAYEPTPFDPNWRAGALAIGADFNYRFEPGVTTFGDSHVATSHSYISFAGRMASDGTAEFPFHVTSHDWQESDRLLAAIMTAVASPTRAIEVGGRGMFDGVMTGSFSAPRISGHVDGHDMRVWGVTWGRATADIVIQGGYVDIANSRIGDRPDAFIIADGRFALGFRNDDAEEIRARVYLNNWPVADLRRAFGLDDWSMDGTIGSGDLDLSGQYRNMFGFGRIRIDDGRAWNERFEMATADLELEGSGLRISRLEMQKGSGRIVGAARIGWDGTYVFNAEGESVPVELLDNFRVETAPLSGRLRFRASGAGEFDAPTYLFDASIDDLFIGDEGVGAVSGRVAVADDVMTFERLVVTSSRLQVLGTGSIGLDDAYTSDLRLRFQETAIDPYLKFVLTDDVSPYTRMVIGGTLAVKGPLASPADLSAETTIDEALLTLYDYDLRNDGPIQLQVADGQFRIGAFALEGSNTNLALTGGANLQSRTFDLSAAGDASLSILQLFFGGITSSGAARLNANLAGTFDAPRLTGDASISDGRFRPFASPHSLEALNGRIRFAATAINLEEMTGRIGTGDVAFGGAIALDGYRVSELNLTARGRSMRLRYPAGFNSTVDMDLFLTGPLAQPLLTGTIDVLRVSFLGQSQPGGGLLGFATAGGAGLIGATAAPASPTGIPLDIQVSAPQMPFIDHNTARIEASADLQVRGTLDAPSITGTIDIAGGEVLFNGNRYFVREGSVDFTNPNAIDPIFDLAAETRIRTSGQTFTVNVTFSGTMDRFNFTSTSDPWLPDSDVFSLMLGGTTAWGSVEERSLRSSQEMQQQMLQTAGAALLASPLTSRVSSAFERTGAFDTVQITPLLTNEQALQQFNPGARVTLGKRISPRVFLTYSRTLGGFEEEIILLEYDQSDRMSWVLSRNEDRTFALDVRVRHVF